MLTVVCKSNLLWVLFASNFQSSKFDLRMAYETILFGKLTLMIYLLIFSAISVSSKTYSFGPFDNTDYTILSFQSSATISGEFVQITPATFNDTLNVRNKSGRVLLPKPFKLWDEHSQRVASFNSSFVININQMAENGRGEGFAFVIAPDLNIPSGSYGQYLGLTNSTTDGNATNRLVAIELDTVKQDFDPDDSHIGINLNSIRSFNTVSWPALRVSKNSSNYHNVIVEYNSQKKLLNVYMIGDRSPFVPVLSVPLKLENYVNQYSYFGFAASTGDFIQLNCLMKWELEVDILPDLEKHLLMKILLPGLALLAVCLAGLWYYFHRKKRFLVKYDPNIRKTLESLPGRVREFGFKDLKKATNNFDAKLKLGQGGFGIVYKGVLLKDNVEVAVKKFSRENIKGKDDFLAELTIINLLRHKNLVRLIGWCHKNGTLLLVYEYMPNGSLDQHLFAGPEKRLSWKNRYNIISGVASALQYIHNEYDQKVLHRDLKASNIMLDSDLNPKLGDFGLARALDNGKTSYAELQGVPGTMGYIAPECILTGKATRESDVFGFGAVILEVVCGKRPYVQIAGFQFLADWVWKLYREGRILEAIDERVGTDYVVEEAERLLLLGLACSHPIANERPKTGLIIQIISGSVPVPYVPPFRPTIVWTTNEDGTTTNTTDFSLATNTLTSSCYNGETDTVQVQIEPATTSIS